MFRDKIEKARIAAIRVTRSYEQIGGMVLRSAEFGDYNTFKRYAAANYNSGISTALLLAARNGRSDIISWITNAIGGYSKEDIAHAAWQADRMDKNDAAELLVGKMARDCIFYKLKEDAFNAPDGAKNLLLNVRQIFEVEDLPVNPRFNQTIEDAVVKTYLHIEHTFRRDKSLDSIRRFYYRDESFSHDLSESRRKFKAEANAEEARLRASLRGGNPPTEAPAAG